MTIGYNSSVDLTRSAVLSEVWFGKGFGSEMYSTYNIVYKVEWTEAGKYPVFRNLIQYNRFDPGELAIPDWDHAPTSVAEPITHSGWIGEYFSSPEINISKFVFPKFMVEHGYTTAVLFDNVPSDPKWLNRDAASTDWWIETFNSKWRYKISLDRSYEGHELDYDIIDGVYVVKSDFIVQFLTTEDVEDDNELNLDNVFIKVHDSNYTNPHSTQISSISTQDLDGNIMSTERANQTMTLPNSFMIGSFMISNDFSLRFMGEQLYLPKPTSICLNWYKKSQDNTYEEVSAPTLAARSETYYVSAIVYPIQDMDDGTTSTNGTKRSVAIDNRIAWQLTDSGTTGGSPDPTKHPGEEKLELIPYEDCGIENLYEIIITDAEQDDSESYQMHLNIESFLYDEISTNLDFISTPSDATNTSSEGGQNGG